MPPRVSRVGVRTARQLPDRADEAADLHRLRQVLLESALERLLAILRPRERRERDGRQLVLVDLEVLAHGVDQVVTGGAGHADVADQQVEATASARQNVD